MEQKPPYDNPMVSGVIVNDVNYVPANGNDFCEPPEMDLDEEEMQLDLEPEEMDVECGEPCRPCGDKSEDVTFRPCEEFKDITIHNVRLQCEGRVLKVKVQLCDICRGRRIRLAVLLYEKECFEKRLRGLRVIEVAVPGMHGCKRKLTVGDFCFVLTEDNICASCTEVNIQVIAHYASFPEDFLPCQ